ncbi:hypothetical protein FRX31_035149 [Thalictrum thalictroides]|uniref:Uncharacterized protein n=1 Tax=Thalictrum thalictroides TaxID=46969 RepID=A0A7J6URQ6_THATH|nr:hypothetical protein FRX31_035149 [Thalictrum thalictroides]
MAFLPSGFQERLQHMEETRNQRLSLLQAEKELQIKKSHHLSEKLSNIRIMEQRCFILEHQNACLNFKVLAHKSQIDQLETKYNNSAQQFRALKSEVEELEEREKEKDKFYEIKVSEMKGFKERVDRRVSELREEMLVLKKNIDELKSSFQEIQSNKKYLNNSEIPAAEAQKAQLLLVKENLERRLASNYQLRAQLQKQLYNILKSQDQERDLHQLPCWRSDEHIQA